MFPNQETPLTALGSFVAGERKAALMKNAVRTRKIRVTVEGTVNVTVAGTGLRNSGSILGAVDSVGISENGVDRWLGDARVMAYISRCYSAGRDAAVRLTTAQATAIGAYALREVFDIRLAVPFTVSPQETSYIEADTRQALEAFVVANLTGSKIVKGGTATVTGLAVRMQQEYDDKRDEKPVFIPTLRQITRAVAAANTAEQIFIRSSRYLRGLCITQDSDAGLVDDIISSVCIIGDERAIKGPNQLPWRDLVRGSASEFGGEVDDTLSHLFVNWIRDGRLSTVFNPAGDRNLRIEANVTPSVTSGATNSLIRVTLLELERVAGLTLDPMPFFA